MNQLIYLYAGRDPLFSIRVFYMEFHYW
jgi:hypothetical protein